MLLEAILRGHQRGVGGGQHGRHVVDMERRADARHHIFALRIHQELAIEATLAGGWITGERDASSGIFAHVAEHHRHDVDAGAKRVRDAVHAAIIDRLLERPRLPHRLDRTPQLYLWIRREVTSCGEADQLLILVYERAQGVGAELTVGAHAIGDTLAAEQLLELGDWHAEHYIGVHLQKPTIGVERESCIAAGLRQPFHRFVVETEIQNGLHHARHGNGRPGAHRHEQGI